MNNIETAAAEYARKAEEKYVAKRGGNVPASAALNVYLWAFDKFMKNPEAA